MVGGTLGAAWRNATGDRPSDRPQSNDQSAGSHRLGFELGTGGFCSEPGVGADVDLVELLLRQPVGPNELVFRRRPSEPSCRPH